MLEAGAGFLQIWQNLNTTGANPLYDQVPLPLPHSGRRAFLAQPHAPLWSTRSDGA